jgi:hypothetical protein
MNVDWSKQYDAAMSTGVEAKVGKLYVWSGLGLGLSFRSMAGNIKSIRRRQPLLCIEISVVGAMGGKLCRFIDRNGERFVLFVENCYLLAELTEDSGGNNVSA